MTFVILHYCTYDNNNNNNNYNICNNVRTSCPSATDAYFNHAGLRRASSSGPTCGARVYGFRYIVRVCAPTTKKPRISIVANEEDSQDPKRRRTCVTATVRRYGFGERRAHTQVRKNNKKKKNNRRENDERAVYPENK